MGGQRAIVIGAGIAGLAFARALSERFEVLVIERDLLAAGGPRAGAPQGQHLHVLLARGVAALDDLFGRGTRDELVAHGAVPVRVGADLGYLGPFGWTPPFDPPIEVLSASRALWERALRARIARSTAITIRDGLEVVGLLGDRARVRGARVRARGTASFVPDELIDADLVIDATGRGSPLASWLERMGCTPPPVEILDPRVGFASATIRLARPLPFGWRALHEMWSPPSAFRAAMIYPIEGGLHLVTLAGAGGDCAPANPVGWRLFARGLRNPYLAAVLDEAEVQEDAIAITRTTETRVRRYDRVALPAGLLPVADAGAAINPIHGQGMTVALLQALRVRRALTQLGWAPEVAHRAIRSIATDALTFTLSVDRRVDDSVGLAPSAVELAVLRYVNAASRAAGDDPEVARLLARVMNMLDPGYFALAPRVMRVALPYLLRYRVPPPLLSVPKAWEARTA